VPPEKAKAGVSGKIWGIEGKFPASGRGNLWNISRGQVPSTSIPEIARRERRNMPGKRERVIS